MREFITLIIAVWGAVLATAIFVLDRAARRPRLRVRIADAHAFDRSDKTSPIDQVIHISITNIGDIDVFITRIGLQTTHGRIRARLFKKYRLSPFWDCSEILNELPQIVEPRRVMHFLVPTDKFHNSTLEPLGPFKNVRLVASDSTGKDYCSPPLSKTIKQRNGRALSEDGVVDGS